MSTRARTSYPVLMTVLLGLALLTLLAGAALMVTLAPPGRRASDQAIPGGKDWQSFTAPRLEIRTVPSAATQPNHGQITENHLLPAQP